MFYLTNSANPDSKPRSVEFNRGLHYFPKKPFRGRESDIQKVMHQLFVCPVPPLGPGTGGYRGNGGAKMPEFDLRCVSAVSLMCRGFNFPLKHRDRGKIERIFK